jgi:hypothetical protein
MGITREDAIQISKGLAIPLNFNVVSLKKIEASSEIFAMSTAGGAIFITKFGGENIGDGSFGEIIGKIHKIYRGKRLDSCWIYYFNDWLLKLLTFRSHALKKLAVSFCIFHFV